MSVLADPQTGRPDIAVVRRPIADARHSVVGYELLPFSDEIRGALLRHEGPKGELLATVAAYERGEFPAPESGASQGVTLAGAYRAALEWADDAGRAFTG